MSNRYAARAALKLTLVIVTIALVVVTIQDRPRHLSARSTSVPVASARLAAVVRSRHDAPPSASPTRAQVLAARALLTAAWSSVMTCESDPSVEVPPGSGRWRSDSDAYPDALGIRGAVWSWAGGPSYAIGSHRHPAPPWEQIKVAENLQRLLGVPGVMPDQPCGRGYGVR